MKYELIHGRELSPQLVERWAQIQEAAPELASPYFRPEFTQAVTAVRDDVFVCVLEDGGRVVGFFPFHRRRGGVGRPVGLGLSDYHGVIAEPGVDWATTPLLKACRLVRWEFDHLLVSQVPRLANALCVEDSPVIETDCSFATYEARRHQLGGKQLKETYRRIRKLEREHVAHCYVSSSSDPEVLRALIAWKREQCRRTGVVDYFGMNWTVELIQRIHECQFDQFAGMLSALYVDDRMIAAHFGMRSTTVWHSWFPGYDHEFDKYSPGLVLLLEMIRTACCDSTHCIDLGKGMSVYKESFMTKAFEVAEGSAAVPSLRNSVREVRLRLERWGRRSALRPLLKVPGQMLSRAERKGRYA